MIYKSGKVDCYEAYDYVKAMIGKIGIIKEFEVFFEDTNPYYEIVGGYKEYYHFILRDDNDNEFWIDTNCGYSGTGPSFTEKILQLLGLREDYNITRKKVIYEKDLKFNHDLNVLVVSNDLHFDEYKIWFMLELKFNNAETRLKTIDALKTLGNITSLNINEERFNKYFYDNKYIDNSFGEYKVNNIFFLNRNLNEIKVKDLQTILNTMITKISGSSGKVKFKNVTQK